MLSVRNLCKTYDGGIKALQNISLDVPVGMFGLLGPNGAGKSSLMRTIASLQRADSGSLTLDGVDLLADSKAARRILGYLPQDFGVYPKISALRLLTHIAVLKGISARVRSESVEVLLKRVNLWDVRHQMLGTYSGGMRQRFGVAQALLGSPSVVIVDEPTAGLDPEERSRLLDLLVEIGSSTRVIMSTHNVQDVAELCSSMAIIVRGQVVYVGTPAAALKALHGRVWQRFVDKASLGIYRSRMTVLSTRLVGGLTEIHVMSEEKPDENFSSITPDLSDAYFFHLQQRGDGSSLSSRSPLDAIDVR